MFCDMVKDGAVQASFVPDDQDRPGIHCHDPSYVRAETILFDPRTRAVHAVLHEGLHFIGHVPEDLSAPFAALEEVRLFADHHSGERVALSASLRVQP